MCSVNAVAQVLVPPFAPDVRHYTVALPYEQASLSINVTTDGMFSNVSINGEQVQSGVPSDEIDLTSGADNQLQIIVLSQDGLHAGLAFVYMFVE